MGTKLIRISKEDHALLKEESEHFDLSIGELVHIHLTWYKKLLNRKPKLIVKKVF